jgi:hypothetical protein
MNIALRDKPPHDVIHDEGPTDDERSSLSALVLMEEDEIEAVSVVMVGWGDHFMRRARDYQRRHAEAVAEWDAWDDLDAEWGEAHEAKLDELNAKYDLGSTALCKDARFGIVEVLHPSLI